MSVIIWQLNNESDLPLPTLSADGLVGSVASVSLTAPLPIVSSEIINFNASLVASVPTLNAEILVGVVGSASLTASKPTVSWVITRDAYGNVSAILPTLSATGGLYNSWAFSLEAPLPLLSALGYTVIDLTDTDYAVWVVNAETGMHSTYTSFNFNSYGKFNGTDIVSLSDGLYEITGDDDDGTNIDANIYWAATDFGSQQQKRIDAVYANVRNATNFNIVLWADEEAKRIIQKSNLVAKYGLHRERALPPLGLTGQIWKVGFENLGGANFELTELEVLPVPSKRRVK